MRDLEIETKHSSPWQSCRWGHRSADGWFGVAPELYLPLEWKFGTITREEADQKPLLWRVGNRKKNITPTTLQLLLLGLGLALRYFLPLVLWSSSPSPSICVTATASYFNGLSASPLGPVYSSTQHWEWSLKNVRSDHSIPVLKISKEF